MPTKNYIQKTTQKPLPEGLTFREGRWYRNCPDCNKEISHSRRDHAISMMRGNCACNSCGAKKRGARHTGTVRNVSRSYVAHKEKDAMCRGYEWDLTIDDIADLLEAQEYKCIMTGQPVDLSKCGYNTGSLDRIDNDLGYVKGNVQVVLVKIQMMRGSYTVADFKEMCNLVANG